ncbi:MAG: hypothetical protein mread185_000659 [Mycoplasmataceae bacterium]|nr:MAG: hypothetical protein mread185_000659 [Mycoplasmataceae bacterium]
MTKKEYNLEPKDLEVAKQTLTEMDGKIDKLIAELDQKDQELIAVNGKITNLKRQSQQLNNPFADSPPIQNNPLTDDEIISQAKGLGMKTNEEYRTALQQNKGNYSKLWWLLLIPVLLVIWFVVKK